MNSSVGNSVEISGYTRLLAISSACSLSFLSIITITSNILLLSAIWKDPLKCFKSVAKFYIVGLSLADLITGLTTEPFFAAYYFTLFFGGESGVVLVKLYQAGAVISGVALKYSFFVILASSWTQFIAITWPHKYRKFVTKRNVSIFMVLAFLYLVLFTSVQLTGVFDHRTFLKVDHTMNTTFLSVNLLMISLLLYFAYRRRAICRGGTTKHRNQPRENDKTRSVQHREKTIDHQFTIVSIYLGAILLLCALPHVVIAYIFLYSSTLSPQQLTNLTIALRISDILLFVKVCTDTFIYAWRLPSYRKTLKKLVFHRRARNYNNAEENMAKIRLTTAIEQSTSSPCQTSGV